jgi:hypothetical protein
MDEYRTGTKLGTTIYYRDHHQPCAWVPNNPQLALLIVELLNAHLTSEELNYPQDLNHSIEESETSPTPKAG